jgi:hypothetical protein
VSRDILDNLCVLSGWLLGLAVLGRVDGQLGSEVAVFVEDADGAVDNEQHDAGAGGAAADAEVSELGLVPQGDVAAAVDTITADSLPGHHDPGWAASGLGAGG